MKPHILALALPFAAAASDLPAVLLGGPEVTKLTWDSRGLNSADFDGDGKLDAAVIDNENAKIVLLYQRTPGEAEKKNARRAVVRNRWDPVVENSRFEKVSVPTGQRAYALAVGDFDGDKRTDLAFVGAEDAITVKYQSEDGGFQRTWKWKDFEPVQSIGVIQAADLNGDGRTDLAMMGKGKLLVFLQEAKGGFREPVIYFTGEDRPVQLFAADADGDGATDLMYIAMNGAGTLRWRRQIAPGVFSAEVALPFPIPAFGAALSKDAAGRVVLTGVNEKSRLIERHAFEVAGKKDAATGMQPVVYNAVGGMKTGPYAVGDLDADGLDDVIVADSKAAQLAVFLQRADGTFGEPRTFPSFTGVNGIVIAKRAGARPDVVITSRKEGVGVTKLAADGRLEFPASIEMKGEPVAVAALGEKAAVVVESDRKWRIATFAADKDGAWKAGASLDLPEVKREPSGLLSGDLNADGQEDLVVCVAREPALVLLGSAEGLRAPLKDTASIRSQLADLSPDRAALIDLDADGRMEIVTCGAGYARAVKLAKGDADVLVADQFNARQPDQKLAAPAFIDTDGDGVKELVFAETGTAFFQILKRDESDVYRVRDRVEGMPGEVLASLAVPLGKDRVPGLLVISRDRFWTSGFGKTGPALTLIGSHDSDIKNCSYFAAVPGDINGDGREEILAFDRSSNLLEVLAPAAAKGENWESVMHFVLFEENMRFRGQKGETNVREILIRDFTGDGRADVLLLVHDRLLLYPQG